MLHNASTASRMIASYVSLLAGAVLEPHASHPQPDCQNGRLGGDFFADSGRNGGDGIGQVETGDSLVH